MSNKFGSKKHNSIRLCWPWWLFWRTWLIPWNNRESHEECCCRRKSYSVISNLEVWKCRRCSFPVNGASVVVVVVLLVLMNLGEGESYGLTQMSPRIVFTKQGPIQGYIGPSTNTPDSMSYHLPHLTTGTFNIRQYGGRPVVEVFKGIPYASPPSGAHRFEAPAPAPIRPTQEVYHANVTKLPCPRTLEEVINRTSDMNSLRALRKTMDLEDCLYLDVYTPLNSDKNRGAGLAVLVFMNSQSDDPDNPFDGSSMAVIGNLIVISVRYRTGVLGFLQPSFAENTRGNFGLWDQIAALQWIKENIAEFGGDPNNVCLMGYDMDASIAGLLALSPVSAAYNGLFHRLILLNGSPFAPNNINTQPLQSTYQLASALRCPLDVRLGDLATCLRVKPIPQLISAADKNIGAPVLTYPFSPIVDGTLVPFDINMKNGPGHGQTVKDMLGKFDILCGVKEGPVLPKVGRQLFNNIDMDRFVTAVIKLTMRVEPSSEPTPEVKREVLKAINQMYGTLPPMRELISDFLIVYPMIDLLNLHSESGRNTFFYVFKDYDPLKLLKNDELSYIFSSKVYTWKYIGNPSHVHDLHPFVLLITLLANFVRSGDPNVVDPSDRFPNPIKSWPKYKEDYGRYLEIASGVQFPSGYRKASTDFWSKTFVSIIKSFSNQSSSDDSIFPPPNFGLPWNPHNTGGYKPDAGSTDATPTLDTSTPIIAGGHNTVVLIGCLLLLLNFMCFLGLFYQRERLKKAEIQLRKRYIETQKQLGGTEESQDIDSSVYAERNSQANPYHPHPVRPIPTISRDAMSETETENGFGPDFLGPNYDPRTKVNRWMQMQAVNNRMLGKGNSFEEYSNPTPTPSDINRHNNRLSRVREDENPYESAPPPSSSYYKPHHHHPHPHQQNPNSPSPVILGLSQLPYQSPLQQQPSSQQPMMPFMQSPLQIQVNSLQRPKAGGGSPKKSQTVSPQPLSAPKAQPEAPVQFLPQLPYQEPFRPTGHLGSDSIPYADSRATSPSIISAPAGFTSQREHNKLPNAVNGRASLGSPLIDQRQVNSGDVSSPTASSTTLGDPNKSSSNDSPKSSSILVTPTQPKRTSTLIVRDLDPPDEELEKAEPKYVPVRTGTLKRSVAVDTDHDGSPAVGFDGKEGSVDNSNKITPSSQIRVTFKENL